MAKPKKAAQAAATPQAALTAAGSANAETSPVAASALSAAKAKKALPESVTLLRPHGFIADDGVTAYHWQQGETVTDPEHIAILMARKADLVGITHE